MNLLQFLRVRSVDHGTGSVGLTLERELNKNPDSLFFPDYYGQR